MGNNGHRPIPPVALFLGIAGLLATGGGAVALEKPVLEDLLETARAQRLAALAAARAQVAPLLGAAAAARAAEGGDPLPHREALARLGAAGALVLVEALDAPAPGPGAPPAALAAEEALLVLEGLVSEPVIAPLLEAARNLAPPGRRRALHALGFAADRDAVIAPLSAAFSREVGEVRRSALASLVRQGGPEARAALEVAFADGENLIVRAGLETLARTARPEGLEAVAKLLEQPARAAPHLGFVLDYYRALGPSLPPAALLQVLGLLERALVDRGASLLVLERVGRMAVTLDKGLQASLDGISRSQDAQVSEAAEVCLARLGDRAARRNLERRYSQAVDASRNDPRPVVARGSMYLRLGDGAAAAKDFERAIKLRESDPTAIDSREVHVELARAHMLENKLANASAALERAGLNRNWRNRLREDPDFAPLLAHSRYGKVLSDP